MRNNFVEMPTLFNFVWIFLQAEEVPGVKILQIQSALHYGNAEYLVKHAKHVTFMQNTAPAFQLDSITIGQPRKKPQAATAFAKLSSRRISLPAKFYKRKSTAVAPRRPQTLTPVSLPNFDILSIKSLSEHCLVFLFKNHTQINQSINQSINRFFS